MVLAACDLHLSEKRLRELCAWSPERSVSSSSVVAAARALGVIYSREDFGMRLHDLREALRLGIFPIVGVDLHAYGQRGQHAQVVASVSSRGVRILDPLLGPFVASLLVLEHAWSGSDFLTILIE